MWLPTAAEMSAIDRSAIDHGSIPERALIENAGRELATIAQTLAPEGSVVVMSGSGHNGADALVAGRTLAARGRNVRAFRCGSRAPEPDVLSGYDLALEGPGELDAALAAAGLVIDGLLGTGLDAAPREGTAATIDAVNRSEAVVVAADGPSGVNFTDGRVPGVAVEATATVTFGWPKLGLLRFPAREYVGELFCVEIGFPPPPARPGARAITGAWAASLMPSRTADAHKGNAGRVCVVAGAEGMAGAAVLAGRAALLSGAGLVRIVSTPSNREIVQTAVPDAVFVDATDAGAVDDALSDCHASVVGPGLGGGPGIRDLVARVLTASGPAVLDADALNVFTGELGVLRGEVSGPTLLTPHPGEAARLLGCAVEEIKRDPGASARSISAEVGAAVLLKGAPTVVVDGEGPMRVSTLLAPAFATGGAGDVLAGACAAFLASGALPADAATLALALTGAAAVDNADAVGRSAADVVEGLVEARVLLAAKRPPHPPIPSVRFHLPAVGR